MSHLYYGDINGDGKINIEDIILCELAILYGINILNSDEILRADINKDAKINISDLIKIRNHILGTNILGEI